jgi:DNA-binding SARP family transcriptional activator
MTSLRILGPVQAWGGQEQLNLGGALQVKLLAFLVLNANKAVSRDALLDAVWGPVDADSRSRVQMAIARLRKALEPLDADPASRLQTVAGGYLLSVAPGELDADVFQADVLSGLRALDGGRPA